MAGTWKMIDVVGTSSESMSVAIENAVRDASKTVRKIGWFQVVETRGAVKDGKVAEFQVTVRLGFRVEG